MTGRVIAIVLAIIIAIVSILTCTLQDNYNQYNPNYVSALNYIDGIDDEYSSWHVVGRASPISETPGKYTYVLQRDISRGLSRPSTVTNQYKYRVIAPAGTIVNVTIDNPFQKLTQGQIVQSQLGSMTDAVTFFKVDLTKPPNDLTFWKQQGNKPNKLMYNNYVKFKEGYTCNENNPINTLLDPVVVRGNRFRYNKAEQAQRLRYVFGTSYKVPRFSQRSTIGLYGTATRPFEGQIKK